MQRRSWRCAGWVAAAWVGLAAAGCDEASTQAGERHLERANQELRSALERLDTSTAQGRREAYEALRLECELLRERVDGAAQELTQHAQARREEALRELVRLNDVLERQLDELEDSAGERWTRLKSETLLQAERLRLECERLLGEEG